MALTTRLDLRQRHTIALTPSMLTSLALLQMPAADLREEVARETAENPFLSLPESGAGGEAYQRALEYSPAQVTFHESLEQQLGTMRLSPQNLAAALFLIGELRADGYLDASLEEIATAEGLDIGTLTAGLEALQSCDPPGVGARDLAECLALKLIDRGVGSALARAAVRELDAFAEENWPRLARTLKAPSGDLRRIAGLLRGFSPAPRDPDDSPPQILVPELVVEPDAAGRLVARPHPGAVSIPRLAAGMGGGRADLDALRSRAQGLVAALRARAATLQAIGTHLAERQAGFFLDGHAGIRPETRAEAAAALGLHPSTLGRAVRGKALVSGNRTVLLETFFSQALQGSDAAVSAFDVRRRIGGLIAAEPDGAPLADAHICDILREDGIDIARRTVAKYRKCMRIPSSHERRRRKASKVDRPAAAITPRPPRNQ